MFLVDFINLGHPTMRKGLLISTIIICAISIGLIFISGWFVLIVTVWATFVLFVAYKTVKFHEFIENGNARIRKYAEENNQPLINLSYEDWQKLKKEGVIKIDGHDAPIIYENFKGI